MHCRLCNLGRAGRELCSRYCSLASPVGPGRSSFDSPEVLTYLRKAALGREEPRVKQLFFSGGQIREAGCCRAARPLKRDLVKSLWIHVPSIRSLAGRD